MNPLAQAIVELALILPDYNISLENELGPNWQSLITDASDKLITPLAHFSVSGDGNAVNTPLTLTQNRLDNLWSESSGIVTYTSSTPADRVEISAMTFYDETENNQAQRMSPQLELLKNGSVVAKSSTGYQRHTNDHADSSNGIFYVDYSPGASPTYSLRSQRGADQTESSPVDLGHFSLIAVQ